MDFLYLRARTVRYIHMPGNLDPAAAIEAHRRAAAEALAAHRRHGRPVCSFANSQYYGMLSAIKQQFRCPNCSSRLAQFQQRR